MSIKPTCKEVHRLTSEGLDRKLSLVERARVRVHLLVCVACRNFTSQMDLIRRAMHRLSPPADSDTERESK